MVIISFTVSLMIGIQDPIIQSFVTKMAGGYISNKTGADIKIGQLTITPDFALKINDLQIKDLKDNNLISFKMLKVTPDINDILNNNIHIKNVEIDSLSGNLIRYKGEDGFNFDFLANLFASSEKKEKSSVPMPSISIDRIRLHDIAFEYWDQDNEWPHFTEMHQMDYAHINVFDICIDANNVIIDDGVKCELTSLKAKDISGFEIKRFSSLVDVSSKGIIIDSLKIQTNNSDLDLDLHMLYDNFNCINYFIDSVRFEATIRPTDILLSDIGHFAYIMYEMPDRFLFQGVMDGPVSNFTVKDIVFDYGNDTHFEGAVGFDGLPDFFDCNMFLDVNKMSFSYNDIDNLRIPSLEDGRIPIPEELAILGKGNIKAHFKGTYYDFTANAEASTEAGNINADIVMNTNKLDYARNMSGNIKGNNILLGKIVKIEPTVGNLDLDTQYECLVSNDKTSLSVNGNIFDMDINGEKINNINIDGNLEDDVFDGKIKINDQSVKLAFDGKVDFKSTQDLKTEFKADIDKIDLYRLHITNSPSIVKANIQANTIGSDIDNITGDLTIDSLTYSVEHGNYSMNELVASVKSDEYMQRKININCDFFDFELGGTINFAALPTNFMQYLNHYSEFPYLNDDIETSKYKDAEQDFYITTNIINASTICTLFIPDLEIANNTTFSGTYTSKSHLLNMTLRSKYIKYGGMVIDQVMLRNTNGPNSSLLQLKANNLLPDGAIDSTTLGLNNINVTSVLANDTIYTNLSFNGHQLPDRNKVTLNTKFKPGEKEYGRFFVSNADILIDGSKWQIEDDNYIDFMKEGGSFINNITLKNNSQKLTIDGFLPLLNSDTLSLAFNDFDLSTIDFITIPDNINLDGYINGSASISGINQTFSLFADTKIDSLALNGDLYGNTKILSYWDDQNENIHLIAGIKDKDLEKLSLRGVYFPYKDYDNLEFRLVLNDLRLNIIEPFTQGIVDKVEGTGTGIFDIIGSLKEPVIEGNLTVKNGGCHIDYLNTYYTFEPKIKLSENLIEFDKMSLTDTLGNKAYVKGNITHNYFDDFNINLQIMMREFLALATSSSNTDFYGTAFANGLVEVKGPLDDINLNIKASTQKGTNITIPLNNSTRSVKSKDYIVFINKNVDSTMVEEKATHIRRELFSIDLDLTVNNNTDLKIILPSDIGTIEANGNGNIKIGVESAGDFTLSGDYVIENGQFDLVLENILRKKFSLEKGGTISFSGDPLEGIINASGIYQCKAPLSSAGIVTDSTTMSNNINVESIIHLRNKLINPDITFGMRLPNANEDLRQSLFSVIDTTNQAVMTQQTFSLLVLNSFSGNDSGNSFTSGINSGSFSILTAQLNSWLSQISRHFDIGFNYKPGDEISNNELQIALKTQLFNDYLTIESSVGFINKLAATNNSASSIVGEVDVYLRLTRSGNLTAHFYNHSNNNTSIYNYSYDRMAPYTQGLGISYSKSFDKFKDLFTKKSKNNNSIRRQ